LSFQINNEPIQCFKNYSKFAEDNVSVLANLFKTIKNGAELHAWNAEFEYMIWNYVGNRLGWEPVPLESFFCSMAVANSFALPAHLGNCGDALNLNIQKDKRGNYLINKLSKPRKPSKTNPAKRWTYETATEDYESMYDYCNQDVRAEKAITEVMPVQYLLPQERELWLMTIRMNENGIPIDADTVKNIVDIIDQYKDQRTQDLRRITNDFIQTHGQRDKILTWLEEHNCVLPDCTAPTITAALSNSNYSGYVKEVLLIRQELSKTSTKKLNRILESLDKNNYIHDILFYHRASTGRWGGKNFQLHNLPRIAVADPELVVELVAERNLKLFQLFYDNPLKVGSAMLRPIIKAKPGYHFKVADFASIENRKTCWLAGDEHSLELFRQGKDQYKWFATKLYKGVTYEDVTKYQRTVSKTAILGLGYGMGVEKFFAVCKSYGLDITIEQANVIIDTYRSTYKKIKTLWFKLYKAAMQCIETGVKTKYNYIKFERDTDFLYMVLPSGRKVSYYKPKIEMCNTPWGKKTKTITFWGISSGTRKWAKQKLIRGTLTENAAQASSRDILATAKLRLIAAGYNVIFSVHDEVISHDRQDFGSLKEFNSIMEKTDSNIYPGLPIKAEGFIINRYKKG
jgi:DNA polymerase